MQVKPLKMIRQLVYLVSPVLIIIYAVTRLRAPNYQAVVCTVMFLFFVCMLLLYGIAMRRNSKLLAEQLFKGKINCTNRARNFLDGNKNNIEVTDSAADDFLRAIDATSINKQRN